MTPAIDGFTLRKGDSYLWNLSFDDGQTPATPISIVGKTLTFTVKDFLDDPDEDAPVQVVTTFPDDADSLAGTGSVFVPHTETQNLTPGQKVFYDFQLSYTDTLGRKHAQTLAAGIVKVDWEVTQTVP